MNTLPARLPHPDHTHLFAEEGDGARVVGRPDGRRPERDGHREGASRPQHQGALIVAVQHEVVCVGERRDESERLVGRVVQVDVRLDELADLAGHARQADGGGALGEQPEGVPELADQGVVQHQAGTQRGGVGQRSTQTGGQREVISGSRTTVEWRRREAIRIYNCNFCDN